MCFCTTGHVCQEYSKTDMTMHWKNCILTDNVKALEDQMLAHINPKAYNPTLVVTRAESISLRVIAECGV